MHPIHYLQKITFNSISLAKSSSPSINSAKCADVNLVLPTTRPSPSNRAIFAECFEVISASAPRCNNAGFHSFSDFALVHTDAVAPLAANDGQHLPSIAELFKSIGHRLD